MTGTFEGVGSLQFTPDNKFGYGFGIIADATTEWKSLLSFKTESEYLVGDVTLQGLINYSAVTPADGYTSIWRITFNGDNVIFAKTETHQEDSPMTINIPLIIPPFTEISIDRLDEGDASTRQGGASFVGKVFGAIEQINFESITDDNKWAQKGPF